MQVLYGKAVSCVFLRRRRKRYLIIAMHDIGGRQYYEWWGGNIPIIFLCYSGVTDRHYCGLMPAIGPCKDRKTGLLNLLGNRKKGGISMPENR